VPRDQFRLLQGADVLTTYTFNTVWAKHTFCSVCGIKSFYVPRSHPDGISVSARCLDPGTVASIRVTTFDGQHWEEHHGPPRARRVTLRVPSRRAAAKFSES
jgi:hypothetical protein